MVSLMNLLALGEVILLIHWSFSERSQIQLGWVGAFLIFSWMVFNLLNLINWYPGKTGKFGIRIHFQKNLVPASYLLAFAFALKILGVPEWGLFPFILLVFPMYYVAVILLAFHFRDKSELRPSYFSQNFYLQDEETL